MSEIALRFAHDELLIATSKLQQEAITTTSTNREQIVLEVADNGPGITAELKAKIFNPFFSTRHNGLGMGLSIVQTIAEGHHAVLSIRDGEPHERGACFRVVFPALADDRSL